MILTCPCCHSRYSVDAAIQDEAARELLALRGDVPPRLWTPLIAYLGLFRSEARALAWDRALRLAVEVRELGVALDDWERLETALGETVEAIRAKGSGKALKNHNYLKRVLENTAAVSVCRDVGPVRDVSKPIGAASKTASALNQLDQWKRG